MWCSLVWRGVAWCGVAWCGVAWCGVVRLSTRCASREYIWEIGSLVFLKKA